MKTDVAIVGAGPAGSATAILLARAGYRVSILDRAEFPRDKACGEFVNGAACQMLESLGIRLDDVQPVQEVRLSSEKRSMSVPLRATGRSIPRVELDRRLVEQARSAGASVYPGYRAIGVEGNRLVGEGFKVDAEWIIAADGTHSLLARNQNLTIPIPRLRRVGVVAHVRLERPIERGSVLLFGSRQSDPVVGGLCMQDESSAILSCVLPANMAKGLDVQKFVRETLRRRFNTHGSIIDAKTTGCFGHRLRKPATGRTLFVGDAVQFVDPFTGEGIHHAVEGAFMVAESIDAKDPVAAYTSIRKSLEHRYRLCDVIQAVVHRPAMLDWFTKRLADRPGGAEKLFSILTDAFPAREAARPGLWREVLV